MGDRGKKNEIERISDWGEKGGGETMEDTERKTDIFILSRVCFCY